MTFHSTKALVRILLLSLLVLLPALAQRPQRDANSLRVQYLAFERPGPSPDTSIVDFLYRLPGNQFVFLRDQQNDSFVARGEIFVEFRDEDKGAIVRDFAAIEIRRHQQVRDQDEIEDFQGLIRLLVPAGEYRAIVEVKDLETGRSFLDRTQRFQFGLGEHTAGMLGNPLLAYPDSGTGSFIPFNRGRSVRFGSRGGILLAVHGVGDSAELSWELTHTDVEGDGSHSPMRSTMPLPNQTLYVSRHPIEPLAYAPTDSIWDNWSAAYVPLPLEKLEPGTYTLRLTFPDGTGFQERSIEIPVVWENRPMSLARFDLAVDALRYIASEEDIDDMVGFMADGGRERFREFWKRKDPDTSTAYNEVQAEYYRRVDETITRFSTQGELDGYRSDRGRIYILYGTPTSMNRLFRPDSGPREVWEYISLRKRFIFTDPSRTGEYTLSQTEDL